MKDKGKKLSRYHTENIYVNLKATITLTRGFGYVGHVAVGVYN